MDYVLLLQRYTGAENNKGSAQKALHAALKSAIQDGALAAGTRLLSSRVLAQELGIARNTVVYAYEQLVSEGYLSTDRRGSVVNSMAVLARQLQTSAPSAQTHLSLAHRAQNLMSLPVAADLTTGFAPGVPSLPDFPLALWRKYMDRTWRHLPVARLGYADAAGEWELRSAIVDHLRASRGVDCDPDQVFITDGTQSSLSLCAHALADVGDQVWIENPGYVGAQVAFRSAQLNLKGISVDQDGIAPQASDWEQYPPRLIYVTPSHQYPTGHVLSLNRRLELIRQAQQFGSLLIEDDYDSEFRHDGPPLPAMQGLVSDAPVVYLGTFSKTMFPALRIAYIILPKNLVSPMRMLMGKASLRGRSAEQICLAKFIRDGHFLLHLRRMRRLYQQRRDALVQLLHRYLDDIVCIQGDSAGMHLSLTFRDASVDDVLISQRALARGIVVPALSVHLIEKCGQYPSGLMLGYAQVPVEAMEALVFSLAQLIRSPQV